MAPAAPKETRRSRRLLGLSEAGGGEEVGVAARYHTISKSSECGPYVIVNIVY